MSRSKACAAVSALAAAQAGCARRWRSPQQHAALRRAAEQHQRFRRDRACWRRTASSASCGSSRQAQQHGASSVPQPAGNGSAARAPAAAALEYAQLGPGCVCSSSRSGAGEGLRAWRGRGTGKPQRLAGFGGHLQPAQGAVVGLLRPASTAAQLPERRHCSAAHRASRGLPWPTICTCAITSPALPSRRTRQVRRRDQHDPLAARWVSRARVGRPAAARRRRRRGSRISLSAAAGQPPPGSSASSAGQPVGCWLAAPPAGPALPDLTAFEQRREGDHLRHGFSAARAGSA